VEGDEAKEDEGKKAGKKKNRCFYIVRKPRLMAVGIRCADHATPSNRKGWN
jgi:hypothetical protein